MRPELPGIGPRDVDDRLELSAEWTGSELESVGRLKLGQWALQCRLDAAVARARFMGEDSDELRAFPADLRHGYACVAHHARIRRGGDCVRTRHEHSTWRMVDVIDEMARVSQKKFER